IDVEAGSSTLIVTPAGQSLLIDGGTPNMAGRNQKAIQAAGLKGLDYELITHFHADHYGAIPRLAQEGPIGTFIDHGTSVEYHQREEWKKTHVLRFQDDLYDQYLEALKKSK